MIIDLRQDHDLEQLLDRSRTDPVLIFKHSTQCPISTQAYEEFTDFAEGVPQLICGAVLVIENRKLSNVIAERCGVRYESPQPLLTNVVLVFLHASIRPFFPILSARRCLPMPNRLINETSPYLLQHAHNPVDWYAWGPEALERPAREDKPILLSI